MAPTSGPTTSTTSPLSDELEAWLAGPDTRTLGALIDVFGERSFALLFVVLLGVPALPIPTGGATHVFEVIAFLLALQLIAGRHEIWLPARWRALDLDGPRRRRLVAGLLRLVRFLERFSRPRLPFLFRGRVGRVAFGLLVIAGTAAAFVAPPFTGLDTLPALAVVLLSLAVLLEDALVAAAGLLVGAAGVALEVALASAAVGAVGQLL